MEQIHQKTKRERHCQDKGHEGDTQDESGAQGRTRTNDDIEKLEYYLCDTVYTVLRHTNYILLGYNLPRAKINQKGGLTHGHPFS